MITEVENAIVATLMQATALPYSYRLGETYPDDFDGYLSAKIGQIRAPACWAVFLGLAECQDYEDDAGVQGTARFALVVAAQNLRSEAAARQGGVDVSIEPGAYRLAEDASRLLSGSMLGLDLVHPVSVNGMRPIARTTAMAKNNLSLMAIELTCGIALGTRAAAGQPIGDFQQLHADWDVPPHGNVEPPLPTTEADMRQDVELPQ